MSELPTDRPVFSHERIAAMRERMRVIANFNALFRNAWTSICRERGYFYDHALGTASHGTIALRSYCRALGL